MASLLATGNILSVISSSSKCRCSAKSKNIAAASSVKKPEKTLLKINGTPLSSVQMEVSSSKIAVNEYDCNSDNGSAKASALGSMTTNGSSRVSTIPREEEKGRQHEHERELQLVPLTKQMVDEYRQGRLIEGGVAYRQTLVVRSYEVGPDKTATIETFLNLFQETALNHVWLSGLLGDGFGATHGMISNNLIWVVSRMQVQVDSYPLWGGVVEIDTWVGASGKNGMRRDWLIRSNKTGRIFARATSTWVMMNRQTRRLSKMPDAVRDEVSPWFLTRRAIVDDSNEKIIKLDDNNAQHILSDLKPRRSDLDMNHHVNNVKYVVWMLETVPESVHDEYELSGITLEYRRECGRSDVVQSLCQPVASSQGESYNGSGVGDDPLSKGLASELWDIGNGIASKALEFTHLLRMKAQEDAKGEIVRGTTLWTRRHNSSSPQNIVNIQICNNQSKPK